MGDVKSDMFARIKADYDRAMAEMRADLDRQIFTADASQHNWTPPTRWEKIRWAVERYGRGWKLACVTGYLAAIGHTERLEPERDDD